MNLAASRAAKQLTTRILLCIGIVSVISFILNAKVYSDILNSSGVLDDQELYDGGAEYSGKGTRASTSVSGTELQEQLKVTSKSKLARIQCERVNSKIADDLVYWYDIPSDDKYMNPFQKMHMEEKNEQEKYFVFQKDQAGWNNVR